MDIPVLVEPLPNHRFRARCGEPFALCAEGSTHSEAIENLDQLVHQMLANGTRLEHLQLDVGAVRHLRGAGILKDHPRLDEWIQSMKDNRCGEDADAAT